ncbi:uncharacterized protein EAF02_005147 [Botrytis sinoallii]|uniref:uncharacterized protein n=1 Tax=Botrytis sinoallii TaxID=1463999 RepID=UPI001900F917|nr:uncharacterized protein EAF02_005147 [Botrytis sinoallii]KAF7883227.1 hypothetical protein EAF02_005147 [Botrytis sinoallii]
MQVLAFQKELKISRTLNQLYNIISGVDMDPLSISASISGLISIVKNLSGTTFKYVKSAKGASEEIKQLAEQMIVLFGILNSLSLVASRFDDESRTSTIKKYHEVAAKPRHPDSGQWFFTCEPLKEWLASKGSKLWLHGIPGAGKTVLSSSIITFIATKLQGLKEDECLAFFYCDYKDSRTHDSLVILGSLIKQLSLSNQRCLLKLESFWKQQCSDKFGGQDALNSATSEQLCNLIRDMSSCVDNINIIVDALDECGDGRSKVVELLSQLTTDEYNNIRVILTSREEFDIEHYLKDFKKVSIAADKSDLRLYVHAELKRRLDDNSLIVIKESPKQEIAHRLVNDAEAIREALQSLPPTLFGTYERILDRANSKSSDTKRLVRRVLAWTVCSPFPLLTGELLEAIAINLNDNTLSQDSMANEKHILKCLLSREFKIPGDINEYVNHAGEDGAPLYLAAIGKKINTRVECMELIIRHGAEINLVSGPQGTPLMAAYYHGAYDSVVYLLKHGASTTCKKRDGIETTAMQAAYLHKDIILLLQSFQDNGPKALEEPRTVMNANILMLEWCMLRLENNEKEAERENHLSLFEEASSQPWWTEDIDTHED